MYGTCKQVCIADILKDEGVKTEKELQEIFSDEAVCFKECDVTQEQPISGSYHGYTSIDR